MSRRTAAATVGAPPAGPVPNRRIAGAAWAKPGPRTCASRRGGPRPKDMYARYVRTPHDAHRCGPAERRRDITSGGGPRQGRRPGPRGAAGGRAAHRADPRFPRPWAVPAAWPCSPPPAGGSDANPVTAGPPSTCWRAATATTPHGRRCSVCRSWPSCSTSWSSCPACRCSVSGPTGGTTAGKARPGCARTSCARSCPWWSGTTAPVRAGRRPASPRAASVPWASPPGSRSVRRGGRLRGPGASDPAPRDVAVRREIPGSGRLSRLRGPVGAVGGMAGLDPFHHAEGLRRTPVYLASGDGLPDLSTERGPIRASRAPRNGSCSPTTTWSPPKPSARKRPGCSVPGSSP